MNDQAARGGCFGARDTAAGLPGMWFGMIPETRILDYEIFGIGGSHPAAPPRKMSDDEWDRVAATMTRQPLPLTVSSDAAQPTHQDQSPKPDPAP